MKALARHEKRGCIFVSGYTGNGGNNGCFPRLFGRCHLKNSTGSGGNGGWGGRTPITELCADLGLIINRQRLPVKRQPGFQRMLFRSGGLSIGNDELHALLPRQLGSEVPPQQALTHAAFQIGGCRNLRRFSGL